MLRKSFIFSFVLAATVTLRPIPITAQAKGAQPPSNARQAGSSPGQQQREEPNSQRNAANLIVPPAPAKNPLASPPQPPDTERKPYDWLKWRSDWLAPNILTQLGLIAAAIWAGCIALGTLRAIRSEVAETGKAAKAAEDSAKATADALATSHEIERAYISFVQTRVYIRCAQDDQGGSNPSKPRQLSVDIHIRNTGRTPGTFLGGYIGYCISDKPHIPDQSRGTRLFAPAFLHPQEHVDFGIDVDITKDAMAEAALKGEKPLWIVGVVDYEDRFGALHQSGYGRKFSAERLSLQFSAETADWNYDRPMHPDNVKNYGKKQKSQKAHS